MKIRIQFLLVILYSVYFVNCKAENIEAVEQFVVGEKISDHYVNTVEGDEDEMYLVFLGPTAVQLERVQWTERIIRNAAFIKLHKQNLGDDHEHVKKLKKLHSQNAKDITEALDALEKRKNGKVYYVDGYKNLKSITGYCLVEEGKVTEFYRIRVF